jgi:hypothetical protein
MRPYKNWAVETIKAGTTGTVQPFKKTAADRFQLGSEPKAPSNKRLRLLKVVCYGAPGTDVAEVQKATYGAIVALEGQSGKRMELGPLAAITKECNPWTSEDPYGFPAPVEIPAGAEYNLVVSYESASKNTADVELVFEIEGVEV